MSYLKLSAIAQEDVGRLYHFLARYDTRVATDAVEAISNEVDALQKNPFNGAPVPGRKGLRKLVVSFGASGYLVFHRYKEAIDTVQVLTILHQKEKYHTKTIGLKAEKEEGW